MVACFKLTTINQEKVFTGSAFFAAEHYLLTCAHTVHALSIDDEVQLSFHGTHFNAQIIDIADGYDLALLYTNTPAEQEWIFYLDRIAPEGKNAAAYGYPHGGVLDMQSGLEIGAELADGYTGLMNANGVTVGFSGGPICRVSDFRTAVGVICSIEESDEYNRRINAAGFIPARIALELWGEKYGLWEKRFFQKS